MPRVGLLLVGSNSQMELRRRSSTPQDAASRAPRFGNSLRIAPRETSGTEGSNPSSSTGESIHNCDQVLIVTSGSGMVATEHERREINVGDVVHIKAGERHWHGAKADTTMGHITITLAGSQATHG